MEVTRLHGRNSRCIQPICTPWQSKLNNGYLDRYRKAMDCDSEIEDMKKARKMKILIFDSFIRGIESRPLVIDEFDERLWAVAIDRVMVIADGGLVFKFKDGSEINNAKVSKTSLLSPG